MVVSVGRLWRTCRHPCLVFCALAACWLALTVLWRLRDYRRWISSGRLLLPADDTTLVASQTVRPDAVVARNWSNSAAVTSLDDIFISIKTTGKYHNTRIGLLLRTWLTLAQKQVGFITDLISFTTRSSSSSSNDTASQ